MSPNRDDKRFKTALLICVGFIAFLWGIKGIEWITDSSFRDHSIFPRDTSHLYGIFLAPLLHGSFSHLASNSVALLVLGTSLIYGYPKAAVRVLPAIYCLSGLGVWFWARDVFHLGASGLTFGMMFFVFAVGVLRWDRRAIALSMIVFFLYGSMIWGIFPGKIGISFEYHFFGAAIGVVCAFLFRRLDPEPARKKYSWELEETDELDDFWMTHNNDSDAPTQPPER